MSAEAQEQRADLERLLQSERARADEQQQLIQQLQGKHHTESKTVA